MANKYAPCYLPIAVEDLISIFGRIISDNPDNTAALIEKINQRIGGLKMHPLPGRIPLDDKLKESGYRFLVIESYLVFYVNHANTLDVHRIAHRPHNLDDILKN